ncbi:MAG TPA: PP2C family protein-serine/threonine phosphatase [Pseudonocardiaceae bacterium]
MAEVHGDGGYRMLAELLEASHLATLENVPALVARHAARVGLRDPVIYLADLCQDMLVELTAAGTEGDRRHQPVDSSLPGRAYGHVEIVVREPGTHGTPGTPGTPKMPGAPGRGQGSGPPAAHRVWLPLLDGTERLGVLGATVPEWGPVAREHLRALASLVALMIVSKRPHSDTYARLVRSRPMTLPAEVIRPLLPPLTVATPDLVVCAQLEPAYEVGGDIVDLALSGSVAHVSVFDAMGHDQSSGLITAIATGTCRNERRQGTGLVATSEAIDRAVGMQFGRRRFVTGVLADLDRRTGELHWVNRGHPPPLLIRGGRRLIRLDRPPAPPMGFQLDAEPRQWTYQLEPGDRLLLYTDGVVEARDEHGRPFGLNRFVDLTLRRQSDGLPVPETLRRLMRSLLDHHGGRLQDDATVMLVEWQGDEARRLLV